MDALVVKEEKCVVRALKILGKDNGSTERTVVDVALEVRNGASGAVRKPAVGIERRVPIELIADPMQMVRAGLGDHVHNRSTRIAELGAEVIGLYLELLHGVYGWLIFQIGDSAVLFDIRYAHAVEQHVGRRIAIAIGSEVGIGLSAGIQV